MQNKQDLVGQYVNLYRQLWLSNIWSEDLERMSEKELKKEIREMKKAIKEKNGYYPAFEQYYRKQSV